MTKEKVCDNQYNTGGKGIHPNSKIFYVLREFSTLTADVMFVNGLPFLITLSRKIKMFTAEYIPTQNAAHLSSSLENIVKLYARNEFLWI